MSHLRGSSTGARQAGASRATDGYRKQARACGLLDETVVGGETRWDKAQMDHAHRPSRSLQPLHPSGIEIRMSAWQRCCKTLPVERRTLNSHRFCGTSKCTAPSSRLVVTWMVPTHLAGRRTVANRGSAAGNEVAAMKAFRRGHDPH